jgi:hypothetical protein
MKKARGWLGVQESISTLLERQTGAFWLDMARLGNATPNLG